MDQKTKRNIKEYFLYRGTMKFPGFLFFLNGLNLAISLSMRSKMRSKEDEVIEHFNAFVIRLFIIVIQMSSFCTYDSMIFYNRLSMYQP